MTNYIRLNDGLNKYELIPANDDIWTKIKSNETDYYTSLYQYNEEHYQHWKEKKSVAGIKNTTTNRLVFDFDNAFNIDAAKQDALTLISRLINHGIKESVIQITFSGSKGFGVEVAMKDSFTPDEFKRVTTALAGDLPTFDTVVSDPNRIVRVVGTKHPKSGLYKKPLTLEQLKTLSIDEIKTAAKSIFDDDAALVNTWGRIKLPDSILNLSKEIKVEKSPIQVSGIDLSKKPRFLDLPRWYLQNGFFGSGERHNAFLCLAATYKNLGFELDHTYRLLKGVAEIQAERNGVDRYSDKEIFIIVKSVYDDSWNGGQFSLKDENSWLFQYAKKYNLKIEEGLEQKPMVMSELGGDSFARYAKSFYETRIYTGLDDLDEAFPICAGSNVAIVAAASAGKTTLALNMLKEMNKQNAVSVFASLDMSKSRLYEKMLYSVTNGKKSRDDLYQDYIAGKGKQYDEMVNRVYPNTYIFGKSSPTIQEVRRYIESVQDHTGKPVRLLMIDYFERLNSEKSDDTAASKDVAGGIQDLIADFPELTPITLYQPNKFSLGGGPDKPILNYTAIKGSSFVYQAARQILSLWRPFFTPDLKDYDKFIEMAILKNDLGELGKFCYNWEGKTGIISEMSDIDRIEYAEYMKEKNKMENSLKQNEDF